MDAYAHGSLDVLIAGVQAPLMDGSELLRRMRATEQGHAHRLPIVALAAHAMHGDAERFLAEGFDACLSKPVSDKRLEEVLGRVYARRDG